MKLITVQRCNAVTAIKLLALSIFLLLKWLLKIIQNISNTKRVSLDKKNDFL